MKLEMITNDDYKILELSGGDRVVVYAELRKGYDDNILTSSTFEDYSYEVKEEGYTVSLRFLINGIREKFDFFSYGLWNQNTLDERVEELRYIVEKYKTTNENIILNLDSPYSDECIDLCLYNGVECDEYTEDLDYELA